MKKFLGLVLICVLCVSTAYLALACKRSEPSDGDNEEPAKTYKINCIEDDAYIITAPEEAEEGEEVTVTVQLDDVDNYIERVTYDRYNAEYTPGYDCEPAKDGGYTFTMPDFDVELKVEVGTFEEVLKGGMSGFAEFISGRTISADSVESEECPIHKTLLGAGALIIENLRGLDALPEGETFLLAALPMPLADAEGAPARVTAILEN